ncbi:bifunctional folylpolyglutamate synthase/dihydrofolate synthase [Bremerella alba]|uniref:Dihydrofolate synthase/folylpolyglutamate synthase n=1 Tax=Bremerella alba TaxID=980252 RepID=A0A7V8V9W1_9BACT|nr:folylpolyglutamate synthase/dihydrofolate synthase family protein [Bremerella alba]MBA2117618.1 Folylpolyglutamate synthase [Bremerella alba]
MDASQADSDSPQYQEALDWLFQRINYERTTDIPYRSRNFALDRMQAFMQLLGNPQHRLKIVHVAGTKGKGSTSAFLSNILWKAGHRVGRFTSPHLERLEERYWLDGGNCTAEDIVELVSAVRPVVAQMDANSSAEDRLTFFEITTAMGFLLFAERGVDFAVIEVGLGGRLDSTNVCHPLLCIITSISRDHTALLGDTLAEIAGEKAGIIKPQVPVISGVMAPEAQEVIADVATQNRSTLDQLGDQFTSVPLPDSWKEADAGSPFQQAFEFQWQSSARQQLVVSVKGDHQVANAGLAVAAVEKLRELGHEISPEALQSGLQATQLPARIECCSDRPIVIVDAAHNDASAAALVRVLLKHFPDRRRHLVFASSGDKDHAAVLSQLLGAFDQAWFTKYGFSTRSTSPQELLKVIETVDYDRSLPIHTTDEAKVAFHEALNAMGKEDVLVVTGSFFIAAEFKRFWREVGADRQAAASSATQ